MNLIFDMLNYLFLICLTIAAVILIYQRKKNKKIPTVANTNFKDLKKDVDYEIEYVQDFLDFERIYNDMIIREKGTKFTMVISCSGINFDLMSENEKVMVEEGFISLLNFIQFPIQIYVQTRRVDLKDSLKTYSSKINSIENELRSLMDEYSNAKAEEPNNKERLEMLAYEIRRKQNLYEYAMDLKNHIERMNVNSNVLQQKYYIAVTYRIEELGLMVNFSESEILEMAYSELFTRCQSIIHALGGCGIEAKILDSDGLAELLYMAFNRDDAELFRLKDNMQAEFYRLYSTTENVVNMQQNTLGYVEGELSDEVLLLTDGMGLDESSKALLLDTIKEEKSA